MLVLSIWVALKDKAPFGYRSNYGTEYLEVPNREPNFGTTHGFFFKGFGVKFWVWEVLGFGFRVEGLGFRTSRGGKRWVSKELLLG